MMSHFSLLPNDDSGHTLLEPHSPAYTNVTVRRAFIVWLHCGQQNEFRHVCNYFHYLEILEDRLSAEDRATSRLHEFNLLSDHPPSSYYLSRHFPKLYRHNKNNKMNVKKIEEIKLEDCVFNLEGFHDMKIQKGVTTKDIIKTSQMIKKYCKTHSKSLRNFLVEFQDFVKKAKVTNSVTNILMYIKSKYLKDELETWKNLPKNFSFLENLDDASKINDSGAKTEVVRIDESLTFNVDHTYNANKNANKIRILINESRRKELMNIIPNFSDLSIKEHNTFTSQNVLSAKLPNIHKKNSKDNNYDLVSKI